MRRRLVSQGAWVVSDFFEGFGRWTVCMVGWSMILVVAFRGDGEGLFRIGLDGGRSETYMRLALMIVGALLMIWPFA